MTMIGKLRSTRDFRDPLMKQLVRSGRYPMRGTRRIPGHEPQELVFRGRPDRPVAYVCPSCGLLYHPNLVYGSNEARHAYARQQAKRCCNRVCEECAAPIGRNRLRCEDCQRIRTRHDHEAWAARAKVVPLDPDAWIYSDHFNGDNEGYFSSFQDLIDQLIEAYDGDFEDGELPGLPPYVIPCRAVIVSLCLQSIEESIAEDVSWDDRDDALDYVSGLDDLRQAVENFNTANKDNEFSWSPDYSRVVILDADYFNERFGTDHSGLPKTSWSDRLPSVQPYIASRYRERIRRGREKAKAWTEKFYADLKAQREKVGA